MRHPPQREKGPRSEALRQSPTPSSKRLARPTDNREGFRIPSCGLPRDKALRELFTALAIDGVELKKSIEPLDIEAKAIVWLAYSKDLRERLELALQAGEILGREEVSA